MKTFLLLLLFIPILGFGQIPLSEMSREQLLDEKLEALQADNAGRVAEIDYELNSRMTVEELEIKYNKDLEKAISIEDYAEAARIKKIILKIGEINSINSAIQKAVENQEFERANQLKKERDRIKEEVYAGTYPMKTGGVNTDLNNTDNNKIKTDATTNNPSDLAGSAANSIVIFKTSFPTLHIYVDRQYYGIATPSEPVMIYDLPPGQHAFEVYTYKNKRMQPESFTVQASEILELTFTKPPTFVRKGPSEEQDDYKYETGVKRIKNGSPTSQLHREIAYNTPIVENQSRKKSSVTRGALYVSGEIAGSPKYLPFHLGLTTPFSPYSHLLLDVRLRLAGVKYVGISEAIQLGVGYGYDIKNVSLYGLLNGGGNMLIYNNGYDTRYGLEAQAHLGARFYFPLSSGSMIGIYGEGNVGLYNARTGFSIGLVFSGN